MRITLVDNLIMPATQDLNLLDVHPHLGLLSVAAVAERNGHHAKIYDPKRDLKTGAIPYDASLYARAALEILDTDPEAVGFTTLGCSFLFVVRVAELLRLAEPSLPILLGGPHATMLAGEILRAFPFFDVIVRHEVEETLPAVLKNLSSRCFEMIPGISWSTSQGIRSTDGRPRIEDLDQLPLLNYDHYPIVGLDLEMLRVEAGRGCPYECTFCSTAQFFQRRYRLKSPERLVSELDALHLHYGVTEFKLDHDLFTVDRHKVLAFCKAVKDRGYRWRVSARIDRVDAELLAAMADSGCIGMYFGVETGSVRLQKVVKKNLDLSLLNPILECAASVGISTTISVITGWPEETQEDLDCSLDLIGSCFLRDRSSCIPQFHLLTPEPGTPLFSALSSQLEFDGYPTPFNARLLSEDDRNLVRRNPTLFASYHYYPGLLPRHVHTLAASSVDAIRHLDPMVFCELLDSFSGHLSRLVGALSDLALQSGASEVNRDLLGSFVSRRLGLCDSAAGVYHRDSTYRLSPWVRIDTALAQSAAAGTDPSNAVFLRLHRANGLNSWRVDPGLAYLLELFRRPRTVASVIREVECHTGINFPDDSAFREFVEQDILVLTENDCAL